MKRIPFALLRIHLFVALASMLFFSLLSCEPDEGVGGDGNRDPSQNFTDIAVTGAVDAYGSRYADIMNGKKRIFLSCEIDPIKKAEKILF